MQLWRKCCQYFRLEPCNIKPAHLSVPHIGENSSHLHHVCASCASPPTKSTTSYTKIGFCSLCLIHRTNINTGSRLWSACLHDFVGQIVCALKELHNMLGRAHLDDFQTYVSHKIVKYVSKIWIVQSLIVLLLQTVRTLLWTPKEWQDGYRLVETRTIESLYPTWHWDIERNSATIEKSIYKEAEGNLFSKLPCEL